MDKKSLTIMVLVPRVVQSYIARLPEVQRNAYKYFNYDNRVVDERVNRHDAKRPYQGPDDFTDADYDTLVKYAQTLINPVLSRYSPKCACEDALNIAIRHFNKGLFDGKINANKFNVLLSSLYQNCMQPVMAAKEKKEKPKTKPAEKAVIVKPHVLKELGIGKGGVPLQTRTRTRQQLQKTPRMVMERGRVKIEK